MKYMTAPAYTRKKFQGIGGRDASSYGFRRGSPFTPLGGRARVGEATLS